MDTNGITLSFDDIFGGNPEDISLAKLEGFLEKVVTDSFQQSQSNPNELVRVVDNGAVTWMTAEEADSYLQPSDDENEHIKQCIHNALRGDRRILEQEIKVLFILAHNTLQQYRDKKLIPEGEVQRTEPNLVRLGRQVNFQLGSLKTIDDRMNLVRINEPILDAFENKMGELLNLQKTGKHNEAAHIAKDLAGMKHKYVRLSRGLESDMNESSSIRVDLQRDKKSILSTHRYLVAQREGVLQEETHDLRNNIENMKTLLKSADSEKKITYELSLSDKSIQLDVREKELVVVKKEQSILKKKEEETTSVIAHLEELFSQRQPKAPEPNKQDAPTPELETEMPEEHKARLRMAAAERRQR
jgi:hypothetical protein